MNLNNFVEGINILRQYYAEQDGYPIGAEHDEFLMYATDKLISDEDLKKLVALGWFQDEGGADEDTPENYNIEKHWIAYV